MLAVKNGWNECNALTKMKHRSAYSDSLQNIRFLYRLHEKRKYFSLDN